MTLNTPLLLGSAALMALVACDPYPQGNPDNTRARTGLATGAVIGGLLGATKESGSDRFRNAALGAAIGAAVGGGVGSLLDQQANELRGQVGNNVQIVNDGNQLRVVLPQDILFATDSATLQPTLVSDLWLLRKACRDIRTRPCRWSGMPTTSGRRPTIRTCRSAGRGRWPRSCATMVCPVGGSCRSGGVRISRSRRT